MRYLQKHTSDSRWCCRMQRWLQCLFAMTIFHAVRLQLRQIFITIQVRVITTCSHVTDFIQITVLLSYCKTHSWKKDVEFTVPTTNSNHIFRNHKHNTRYVSTLECMYGTNWQQNLFCCYKSLQELTSIQRY
jgi:hypothetical protein